MPERSDRLEIWRNTIQLFHKYRSPPFVGPFKQLGFRYRVCPEMMTDGGDVKKPDIVASGASGWAIIEVSSDNKSKAIQLDGYRQIDSRYLGAIGLNPQSRPPDTLSSRATPVDDGAHCQLLFSPTLGATKLERLTNVQLAGAIRNVLGANPNLLPTIPFTLVPESISKGKEIRRGIAGCVLQVFSPESRGISLVELVDMCLERLADAVSVRDKRALIDSVRDHLRLLVTDFLPDHLELLEDVLRVRPDVKPYPRTLDRVSVAVSAWMNQSPPVTLEKFG